MEITQAQKNKLKKILDLSNKGLPAILEYLFELEDKLETEIPQIKDIISRLKGDKGDNYILTDEDKNDFVNTVLSLIDNEHIAKKVLDLIEIDYTSIAKEASKLIEIPKVEKIDYKKIQKEVLAEIVLPEVKNGKDADEVMIVDKVVSTMEKNLPQFGEAFRDGLELLQGDERLDKSAIKGLDDIIAKANEPKVSYTGLTGVKELIAGSNITIDNSNLQYPVISSTGGGGGGVSSVVAGININVDATDPANPIINSLSDRYKTTSTTSQAIVSTGTLTFTVDANLAYTSQQDVIIAYNDSNHMHGRVVSYSGTTLIIDITHKTGSGTYALWDINLDGIAFGDIGWTKTGTNVILSTITDNVGVGIASPTGKFAVKGNGTGTGVLTQFLDSSNNAKFTVLDNGTVNIVNSSPAGLQFTDSGSSPDINFQYAGTTRSSIKGGGGSGYDLYFSTNGANRMAIDGSGNIGINTTTPNYKLEIAGGTDNVALRVTGTGTGAQWTGRIVAGGTNNVFLMGEYNAMAWLGAHNAALNAWSDFYINPDGTNKLYLGAIGSFVGGPAMTINNANGNVGIGTTTPGYKLDVKSSGNNLLSVATSGFVTIGYNNNSALFFASDAGATLTRYAGETYLDGYGVSSKINFRTGGSPSNRMIIDENGNVGIGTSSPAFSLSFGTSLFFSGSKLALYESGGSSLYGFGVTANSVDFYASGSLTAQFTGGATGIKMAAGLMLGATYVASSPPTNGLAVQGFAGLGIATPSRQLDVGGINATATVNVVEMSRLTRPLTGGVKWGNAAEWALGSYSTAINSETRLDLKLNNGGTSDPDMTAMTWLANGNVGISITAPTAGVHIRAGTATAGTAPLKFTAGTALTAVEAGVFEFSNSEAGLTFSAVSTRRSIAYRNPIVSTITSSATPTPTAGEDHFTVTALAAGATFAAPTGTPTDGQILMIRIKDNGTARTLAFNAIYRAIGVTLPTTTVISKTLYLRCVYNSADTKWDVLAVGQEA